MTEADGDCYSRSSCLCASFLLPLFLVLLHQFCSRSHVSGHTSGETFELEVLRACCFFHQISTLESVRVLLPAFKQSFCNLPSSTGRISSCRHEGEAVAWGCRTESRAAPAAKGTAASRVLPSANFSLTLQVQHLFLLHGRSHQLPARRRNRERRSLLPTRLPASRSLSGSVVRKGPNPAAVGEPLLLPPLSSPAVALSSLWMCISGLCI